MNIDLYIYSYMHKSKRALDMYALVLKSLADHVLVDLATPNLVGTFLVCVYCNMFMYRHFMWEP